MLVANTGRMVKDKQPRMGSPMASPTAPMTAEQRVMMNKPPIMKRKMPEFMKDPGRFTQLDMRFIRDKDLHGARFFRREFDDDEKDILASHFECTWR